MTRGLHERCPCVTHVLSPRCYRCPETAAPRRTAMERGPPSPQHTAAEMAWIVSSALAHRQGGGGNQRVCAVAGGEFVPTRRLRRAAGSEARAPGETEGRGGVVPGVRGLPEQEVRVFARRGEGLFPQGACDVLRLGGPRSRGLSGPALIRAHRCNPWSMVLRGPEGDTAEVRRPQRKAAGKGRAGLISPLAKPARGGCRTRFRRGIRRRF